MKSQRSASLVSIGGRLAACDMPGARAAIAQPVTLSAASAALVRLRREPAPVTADTAPSLRGTFWHRALCDAFRRPFEISP